ncbi:MAG: glycosyltransferase family 4 protein [Nitrospirae bacterium]|nr:glycosyltransferase family 4 protein [Nitrospirota bacterium]
MKIGLDARSIHREGVGRYTRELIKNLSKIDNKNQYIIFLDSEKYQEIEISDNFKFVTTSPQKSLHKIGRFLKDIYNEKLDVFHALDHWYVPIKPPCPVISTFHDLMVKTYPASLSIKSRLYSKIATQKAIDISSWIITVSEFNKKEIINNYHFNKNNISVIYNGVSKNFRPFSNKDSYYFKKRYGIKAEYFFYAGSMRKYKNISTLIKAYAALDEDIKRKHDLVIAGKYEHEYHNLKGLAKSLNLDGKVHFVGYLKEDDLINFYNYSISFITLSLYESFCFPIVEAMACGIPVIAPDRLSFPEITQNTAILLDPLNLKEISFAMERIAIDNMLRETLIKRGLELSERYNWESNAIKVKDIYEKFSQE